MNILDIRRLREIFDADAYLKDVSPMNTLDIRIRLRQILDADAYWEDIKWLCGLFPDIPAFSQQNLKFTPYAWLINPDDIRKILHNLGDEEY